MLFENSKSSKAAMRECFGVDKHVGWLQVIAKDLERAVVIDTVLWNELLETMASDEALKDIGLIEGNVSLGLKMG